MENEIVLFETEDHEVKLHVPVENNTVWLNRKQLAELFGRDVKTIGKHINNALKEELDNSVVANFATTASDGKVYQVEHYNLDMIISLGYRVKSSIATKFRQWATARLTEYIIKGFTMDDERLKQMGGGNYWKELLDRIRDIRSSEKVMYRQVLDIYATAVDYDPRSDQSIEFFKIVQNKLHFAAHGHTAAEVIFERADAEQPMMGLTSFRGEHPTLRDAKIAKNYLNEDELKVLNNLVSGYFDFAEIQAMKHRPMYMADYIQHLDTILSSTGEALLIGAGSISHYQAMDKAETEYRKFEVKTLSPVEQAYLDSIKTLNNKAKGKK